MKAITRNTALRVRSAFTLIEILVVIVVIAILASIVAPEIFSHVGEAKIATAQTQMEEFASALAMYRLDNGNYPTTDQGLAALTTMPSIDPPPNWKMYLQKAVPNDPWGHPYIYICPGQQNPLGTYDLMSYGADGQPGGDKENADLYAWK